MQQAGTTTRPYFRTPDLSPDGRQVVFVYAGDLWLASSAGGTAERITAHPAGHFGPRFSPDGSTIAFSSNRTGSGDIYTLPLEGGAVQRVTYHDTRATVEDWSADGAQIFFASGREQQAGALFRVAATGGTPLELLAEPYEDLAHLRVSPDGTTLAFNTVRTAWWRRGPNPFGPSDVWVLPSEPGTTTLPRKLGNYLGMNRWPLWAADGNGLYLVSDRDGNENLWYQPLQGDEPRQLTHFADGRLLWPSIARTGNTIVFERNFDLWQLDLASGEAAPIALRVRADTRVTPVRLETYSRANELRLAPDAKKIAFVARGEVFADFADKETDREQRQGPAFRVTNSPAREDQVVWTPDSRKLFYISDRHGEDELYLYDFAARSETRLTNDPAPKGVPRVSPDGRWLAFIRGFDEIRLLNLETHEQRPFAHGYFLTASALAWSPDSRWLAFFSQDEQFFANVYLQQIDEQQAHQVTFLSNLEGATLHWAPNGRFLIFTSAQYRDEHQIGRVELRPPAPLFREAEFDKLFAESGRPTTDDRRPPAELERPAADAPFTKQPDAEEAEPKAKVPSEEQKPVEASSASNDASPTVHRPSSIVIEFEGIERRLRLLTPLQMDAVAHAISPDSRDLLFTATVADKVNVWSLPLDEPRQEQPPRQLTYSTSPKRDLQFSPDGKLFYYLDDWQIMSRKFPNGNDAATIAVRAEVQVDFHQEKQQMFAEAWRALRDSFYDSAFRGADWNKLRADFAPAVAGAQTTGELHAVLRLMLGELRSSHLDVSGFGGGSSDGYTGMRFDPSELANHASLRVSEVLLDSPASLALDATSGAAAPVQVGEYLLAVDGTPIGPATSLDALLQRTVGRRVRLRLGNNPAAEQPREVLLRPVDASNYERLRYRTWVATNRAYVRRIGNGRLGYVHIDRMSYPAYQQFLVDLDTAARAAEGVVVDVRFNGGGHTATFILDVLARPSLLRSSFRERPLADAGHIAGNRVLGKPTVLVTNEHSGSNTEMLSESYRRLGLGPVVGKPTAGAVIWTWSMRLLDGSALRLPRMRISTPEGEDLEGTGRPVDLAAELPLGSWARGSDSQLDAAVRALLERIDSKF